jgi:parallel beta-helix repeat protein
VLLKFLYLEQITFRIRRKVELLRKTVFGIMLILLLIGMLTLAFNVQPVKAEPRTWIVDDDGPADFHTIQEAIDAASPGDVIQVRAGTYNERIKITKNSLSIIGEDAGTTIIDGQGLPYVVKIQANYTTVKNFTIRDAPVGEGVNMGGSGNVIEGNIITGPLLYGILVYGEDNVIRENIINGTEIYHDGIWIAGFRHFILGNTVKSFQYDVFAGIRIEGGNEHRIIGNTIIENGLGIFVYDQGFNIIYHNNFVNNVVQASSLSLCQWDDGYPSGGNYWSDYLGVDANGDGIGDTPYIIDANNQDRYPLMQPWSPTPINQPPSVPAVPQGLNIVKKGTITIFTSSATDPDSDDVTVTFSWGDGTETTVGPYSSGAVFTRSHSWSYAGMYEVKAKATDIHGAESAWSNPFEVTVLSDYPVNEKWAGYIVDLANSFVATLSVEGQWIQPSFGTTVLLGRQGTWVGIGGYAGSNLLQAGIGVDDFLRFRDIFPFYMTIQGGQVKWDRGWGYPVSPRDLIETNIIMVGYHQWQISVRDVTKDWMWMPPTVTFDPDLTKAEWIHEPGASGSSVVYFSPIDFVKAQLTINDITYKMGSINPSINAELYQRNFIKDTTPLTTVSPLSRYENFTISYMGTESIPAKAGMSISLNSSANLHVYDSLGNHLGYNATSGFIDVQIPNSMYFEDEQGVQYALLFNPDEYQIDLIGKESGDFHLHIQAVTNETITLDQWVNETVTINDTKTYYLVHQISIQDVMSSKTVVGQGYNCSTSIAVFNHGNFTETFNVTFYANTTSIATQTITLTSGNSTTITFTWNTTGFAKGKYTISAYAWPVPGETDTEDNTLPDGYVVVTRWIRGRYYCR